MSVAIWPQASHSERVLAALQKSFATIEFSPSGDIITANPSFCALSGYSLEEIRGRGHSLFVDPDYARSAEYRSFWEGLGRGEFNAGEFKRFAKGGRVMWLQASYTPVMDRRGRTQSIIKLALDVTAAKAKAAEDASMIQAIFRSQAVIEFSLDGVVIEANDNFLNVVGYTRSELIGKKHSLLTEPGYAQSAKYAEFWDRLRRGEYLSDEFRRLAKGGREVWLQACYNPVFDADGRLVKVVKFATDLTERMTNVAVIGEALSSLAKGDLEHRIERPLMPSLDGIRADFNAASATLQTALQAVSKSASAIYSGTQEISSANDDLSGRTEKQAARLQEAAMTLDRVTAAVGKTADEARQAQDMVMAAQAHAVQSGQVVREAGQSMEAIERSSSEISQIIGVIDEIAFQTNLLALNAGVEAARAGDAGRGFAVVASEVRALAQRTAEAAKEIKTLISNSTREVSTGVASVGQARGSLASIAEQVSRINELVAAIAAGVRTQAQSLEDVNSAVGQMDQMTQQNAAMVEETTAASRSLAHQGEELTRLVETFKLEARGGSQERRSPRRAPAFSSAA